jgi:TonB family protein
LKRRAKLLAGGALAVLLHGLLLQGVLAPGVRGLAGADQAARGEAVAMTGQNVDALATAADEALDVGWPASASDEAAEASLEPERPPVPRAAPARKPPREAAAVSPSRNTSAADEGTEAPGVMNAGSAYARRVREHLAQFAGALPPGASGEARVQFVVETDGRVSDVQLVKRSGHLGLDAVALSLPEIAQPLPRPGDSPQRLEVPVQAIPQPP